MQHIENVFEFPENWIDSHLSTLNDAVNISVENKEWIFRCSHFFDTRTNTELPTCMNKEEIWELLDIFNAALESSRV